MTTVIGISGHSPELKKDYVLIATDGRSSMDWGPGFGKDILSDDEQKIIFNENSNMILSYDGEDLGGSLNSFDEKEKSIVIGLSSIKYDKKEDIIRSLKLINAKHRHSFVFAANYNNSLDLSVVFNKPIFKRLGIFRKKSIVGFENEVYDSVKRAFIGSGATYANKKNTKGFDNLEIKDGRYITSIENLLGIAKDSLLGISKKDFGTGGYMNIGVLTESGIMDVRRFYDLNSVSDFEESNGQVLERLRSEFDRKNASLDEILLKV